MRWYVAEPVLATGEDELLCRTAKQFVAAGLIGYAGRLCVTTRRMYWLPSRLDSLIGACRWELPIMDVVDVRAADAEQASTKSSGRSGSIVSSQVHRPSARTKIAAVDVRQFADAVRFARALRTAHSLSGWQYRAGRVVAGESKYKTGDPGDESEHDDSPAHEG